MVTLFSLSAFSLALLRIFDDPAGVAFSFVCLSLSSINEAVGARVNGLGSCRSSSLTKEKRDLSCYELDSIISII